MSQTRQRVKLTHEVQRAGGLLAFGRQLTLEGHERSGMLVERSEHLPHATAREQTFQPITPGDGLMRLRLANGCVIQDLDNKDLSKSQRQGERPKRKR